MAENHQRRSTTTLLVNFMEGNSTVYVAHLSYAANEREVLVPLVQGVRDNRVLREVVVRAGA